MLIDRRKLLACGAGLAGGTFLNVDAVGQTKAVVNLQLGWIVSGNQVGEVCAKTEGFYAQEGIDLKIQPGGPNIDGVAVVASGRYEAGQVSSSPSLMLAASQEIPVLCFRRRRAGASLYLLLAAQEAGAQADGPGRQEGRHPGNRRHPAQSAARQEQHPRKGC